MTFASRERTRLRDLLLEKGEHAPTLCEGWNNRDMAVHLYLRENNPVATAGMFVKPLKPALDKAEKSLADETFESIVEEWGSGPGALNPVKLLDPIMNAAEHFIHAEDVRRGAWSKDNLAQHLADEGYGVSAEDEESLLKILTYFGKAMLAGSRGSVVFEITGGRPINVIDKRGVKMDGQDVARVKGRPGEILLWLYGREMAEVEVHDPRSKIKKASL